jgi:hypothetical protein
MALAARLAAGLARRRTGACGPALGAPAAAGVRGFASADDKVIHHEVRWGGCV